MNSIIWYDIEVFKNFFSNTLIDEGGNVKQYVVHEDRHDDLSEMFKLYNNSNWFVGYNNLFYDDRIIQWMKDYNITSTEDFLSDLYVFGQQVINGETKKYKWGKGVDFRSIDLMRVGYLDKSLKMVAVNLEWPLIQDLPHKFDHNVEFNEIEDILKYNLNDVEITKALYDELEDDIKLRAYMSKKYGENLMSDSNSGMANKLLNKSYAELTNQSYWSFKDGRTKYDKIDFSDIISDKINFSTDKLSNLLNKIKNTTIQKKGDSFDKFEYQVEYCGTKYTIAKGGIHSDNSYEYYVSNEKYKYFELDWSSFYPFIMIVLGIQPTHLDNRFLEMFNNWVNDRLHFKSQGKTTESNALKILINAIYGKLGSDRYWLYDPAAMYAVTLNGQLFMLMLIEIMEKNGFSVCYSNTDGVFCKVDTERYNKFTQLYTDFEEYTGFKIDDEAFNKLLIKDVNNYILKKESGKLKRGGDLNKNKHRGSWGLMRSYDKPIVAEAIEQYFFNGIPVEETIANENSPMRFCMAQKAGSKFDVYRRTIEKGSIVEEKLQKTNRYFISDPKGDVIYKDSGNKQISMAGTAGEHVLLYNEKGQYSRDRVKDQYYIKEAKKIINPFENQQTSLF